MKVYLNAYLQKNLGDDLFVYILIFFMCKLHEIPLKFSV